MILRMEEDVKKSIKCIYVRCGEEIDAIGVVYSGEPTSSSSLFTEEKAGDWRYLA